MRQRLVEVARRVQNVGRDHQIVAVGFEALLHRVLLDIQHAVVDRRLGTAEARLRLREEAGRDVRVDVIVAPVGKLGQDRGRRRPGAGTDLDHPEPAPGSAMSARSAAVASASSRFAARATGALR